MDVVDPLVQLGRVRHGHRDDEGLGADVAGGGHGLGHDVGAEGEAVKLSQTATGGGLLDGSVNAGSLRGRNVAVEAGELLPAGLRGEVDVGQLLDGEGRAVEGGAVIGGVLEAVTGRGAVVGVLHVLVDGDGAGLGGVEVDERGGARDGGREAEGGGSLGRRGGGGQGQRAGGDGEGCEQAQAAAGLRGAHRFSFSCVCDFGSFF